MSISIRAPKLSDIGRVSRVTRMAYKKANIFTLNGKRSDLLKRFKNKEIGVLAAFLDGKIVGAIRYFFPNSDELHFYRLAVLKSHRNKGIASKLIGRVERIAKNKKCKEVSLECMLEKNLVPFYEKLGYKVEKIKKHQEHHDADMIKKL